MKNNQQKIQSHWWRKSIIGVLFGLTLAYGMVASFAWFGPGGIDAAVKVQFNMWLVGFLWLLMLPFVYLFQSAGSALRYMLIANAGVYGVFLLLRWLA